MNELAVALRRLDSRIRSHVDLRRWPESLRPYAGLRKAIFAISAFVCQALHSTRYNGLGTSTNFLFYRLWSVTWTDLVASVRSLYVRLRALGRREIDIFRLALQGSDKSSFWPVFRGHVGLAAVVGLVAFWFNRDELLGYIDGQYLLTLIRNQTEFAALGPAFSTNPLQGLGDVWYTTNTLWIPEVRFGGLFRDPNLQRVAIHWFAFLEIFLAATLLARWLGRSPIESAAAGWLAVILIAPLTYPALLYNVPPDAPNIATSITVPLAVIVLWAGIGRGPYWYDVLRTAAIVALLWLHLVAISVITTLAYPLIAFVSLVLLAFAWRRRAEFWRKVVWSAAVFVLLFASGLPQVLLGLLGDTAFNLFPGDLPTRISRDLSDGSILLRGERFAWWVGLLGVVGAVLHALFDRGRMRQFSVGVLATVAFIVSAGIANSKISLPGAPPIYYEFTVWAVYPIFAVSVLASLLRFAGLTLGVLSPDRRPPGRAWIWFALPLVAVAVFHGGNRLRGAHNPMATVFPPVATAITDFLRSNVALSRGGPYRGRVATLTGQGFPPASTWGQMYQHDINFIRAVGNDHRTLGLWYYHIPTLVEFSQTLTPLIYAVVKRYLAYPDDLQFRNILNMRRPDTRILRLLGIRYVISDSPAPADGMRRVVTMPTGSENLAVDEVPAPNLGVSPVETLPLTMDRGALEWIGDAGNDFERAALLAGPPPGPLVPATEIGILMEQGGIRVRARSTGRSLVVIPFQFSHCLRATVENGPAPELRRADLLLTGIIFKGELDARIAYRQGPWQRTSCRLADLQEDRAFVRKL